jgi:hypothetical protein
MPRTSSAKYTVLQPTFDSGACRVAQRGEVITLTVPVNTAGKVLLRVGANLDPLEPERQAPGTWTPGLVMPPRPPVDLDRIKPTDPFAQMLVYGGLVPEPPADSLPAQPVANREHTAPPAVNGTAWLKLHNVRTFDMEVDTDLAKGSAR